MNVSGFKAYDADKFIPEIYDQTETQKDDVSLLLKLIGESKGLKILEPFCGNGRILIPLAEAGHIMVGIDKSEPMLTSAKQKIQKLPETVQAHITLIQSNVTSDPWPVGFDLVILGANCLYELASAEMQEQCISAASHSLKNGGYVYLDNNHMEGSLDPSWCEKGIHENRFPTGTCSDGTQVKGTTEVVWFDVSQRLVQFHRTIEIRTPDGKTQKTEWLEQKHPPSTGEMSIWLEKHGFTILDLWGDRSRSPYKAESGRAIYWARFAEA
jgi:SAM-dependent methyltransferase